LGLGLLIAACAASVSRAADVLSHVPDSALAVMVVNSAEKGSEKIDELATKLQLPPPSVLNLVTGQARIDKGLNREGSVAVVMFAPSNDGSNPRGLLLLAVSDYDALIKQLEPGDADGKKTPVSLADKSMIAAKVGDYAAFVEPKDTAVLDDVLAGKSNVGSQVGEMSKWLEAQDAYALATTKGIVLGAEKAMEGLGQVQEQLENQGTEEQVQQFKMAIGIYQQVFDLAKRDVAVAAAGIRSEDKGLHLTGRVTFKSGSETGKLFAAVAPAKADLLAGLPDGKFVFAGGAELSGDIIAAMYKWSVNIIKSAPGGQDLTQADLDSIIKASQDSLQGVKSGAIAMYASDGDAPLYQNVVGLMRMDDSAKFMANYEKSIAMMGELAKKVKSPFLPESKAAKTTIEGKSGYEVTVKMAKPANEPDPITAELMKKMFGNPEQLTTYIAPVDGATVAMGYITPDGVKRAMKSAGGKGIAANTNISKAVALLPTGSHVQGFLSPKGLIDTVMNNVPGIELSPVPALVGDFPDTPPLAFGLKAAATGLETDFVVPEETLEAIGATIARARAVSSDRGVTTHDTYIKVSPAKR
jgi:hypothetical protein